MPMCTRDEQLWSAASMVPGIALAAYWAWATKNTKIVISACMYIVLCFGSIAYHTHCAYNTDSSEHPRWLRLDITTQQLFIYGTAVLSSLGVYGATLVLPLAVLIGLTSLKEVSGYSVAIIAHAIGILAVSGAQRFYLGFQWFVAFCIFAMKDAHEGYYVVYQTIWHLMCHINVHSIWLYMTSAI